jgi:hypothetical protein
MTVKSIVQIDVDDAKFKSFQALYQKYEDALTKAPGKWALVNQQIGESGKVFHALTAAILAQTETLSHLIAGQKTITLEVEKQARAWQGVGKWAKGVAGDIETATKFLLRWSPLVTGILGLGGLYGLDRLANTAASGRRQALGTGTSYGESAAFDTAFSRVVDQGFLNKIAGIKADVRQWGDLTFAGVSVDDIRNKSTTDLTLESLAGFRRVAQTRPEGQWGMMTRGIISTEEMRRLHNTSDTEFRQLYGTFSEGAGKLGLDDPTAKAWVDFKTRLDLAGKTIENAFIKGLLPFAETLPKVTDGLEHLVTSFLAQPELKTWIDDVAKGFENLAQMFNTPGALKDWFFGKKDSDGIVDRLARGAVEGDMSGVLRLPEMGNFSTGGAGLTLGQRARLARVDPNLSARVQALIDSVPPALGTARITSSWRSEAEEEALRRHNPSRLPVARGRSKHTDGRAIDMGGSNAAVMAYLHQHASEFGLKFPVANDPVHVELVKAIRENTRATQANSNSVRSYEGQWPGAAGQSVYDSVNAAKN